MKKNIKVLFIDWYKTLSSSHFFVSNNIEKSITNILQKALFEDHSSLLEPWMRGELNYKDIVDKISSSSTLSIDIVLKAFKDSCSAMELDSPLFIELIQLVRAKGIKVVIATDNMDVFTKFTVPSLKLNRYFDHIISSHQVGYVKDDIVYGKIMFFEEYLIKNSFKYSEAMIFDDSITTEDSYKTLEMKFLKINTPSDVINGLKDILDKEEL